MFFEVFALILLLLAEIMSAVQNNNEIWTSNIPKCHTSRPTHGGGETGDHIPGPVSPQSGEAGNHLADGHDARFHQGP